MEKKNRREQEAEGCYIAPDIRDFWKLVWSLPAPSMLKNFVWKVCHNFIPTRENLFQKSIVDDPMCPLCQGAFESICHTLWSCPSV
jgi:hypothetical protein